MAITFLPQGAVRDDRGRGAVAGGERGRAHPPTPGRCGLDAGRRSGPWMRRARPPGTSAAVAWRRSSRGGVGHSAAMIASNSLASSSGSSQISSSSCTVSSLGARNVKPSTSVGSICPPPWLPCSRMPRRGPPDPLGSGGCATDSFSTSASLGQEGENRAPIRTRSIRTQLYGASHAALGLAADRHEQSGQRASTRSSGSSVTAGSRSGDG